MNVLIEPIDADPYSAAMAERYGAATGAGMVGRHKNRLRRPEAA
jgi:hypothetical protein